MKEIKLTRGKVALVDDEDFEYLNQYKWYAIDCVHTFYARRKENNRHISMHRQILGLTSSKIQGDHKDHDGLNNQKNNLRIANHSQNQANRKSFKNSSSKYIGVCWKKAAKKWQAAIYQNGSNKHLGSFINESEAAIAYNEAAKIIHGEFANLNILKTG